MTYEEHLGKSESVQDSVTHAWLRNAAAVIGVEMADDRVPPLWHWLLFQRWAPRDGLRSDGGALAEGFLPPMPHMPRRMAAGGRVQFLRGLRVGETAVRTSTIKSIVEKQGRAGPLVVLTIHRVVHVDGEVAIDEEQDVVYMPPAGGGRGAAAAQTPAEQLPGHAATLQCTGDALTLFRYSAMTANSHRIHYDLEYATRDEGYPGLLVHGPLQATWLAHLAESLEPSRRLASIEFRNLGPAFHNEAMTAAAWHDGPALRIELRKACGERCMTGSAVLR